MSHIIPEFLFKLLYDEKHRAHVLTTEERRRAPYIQKGHREKLLCHACEGRIAVYEKYAAEKIFQSILAKRPDTREDDLWRVEGVDYHLFKLFHLSILWRASISKSKMFSKVNLGPHEEQIRSLLLCEDPGASIRYPCMAVALCSDTRLIRDYIDGPERLYVFGHNLYRFSFGGFFWLYFISAHNLPAFVKNAILSEDGRMHIRSKEIHSIEYLSDFFTELVHMNRIPSAKE